MSTEQLRGGMQLVCWFVFIINFNHGAFWHRIGKEKPSAFSAES